MSNNNNEQKSKQAPPPARVTAKTMKVAKEMLALIDALPESEEKAKLLLHEQIAEWEYHTGQCQVQLYTHKLTEDEKMAGQTINPITGETIKLTKKGQWCYDCGCSAQEYKRHRKSKKCLLAQQKRASHLQGMVAKAKQVASTQILGREDDRDDGYGNVIDEIYKMDENYKAWERNIPSTLISCESACDCELCRESSDDESFTDETLPPAPLGASPPPPRPDLIANLMAGGAWVEATPVRTPQDENGPAAIIAEVVEEATVTLLPPRPPPPPPPTYEEAQEALATKKKKVTKLKIKKPKTLKLKVKKPE